MQKEQRRTELDLLRILAMAGVILTHIGTSGFADGGSALNLLHSAITWHVPVFVMISGSMFLDPDRELPLSVLCRKYIRHLLICLVVWSAALQLAQFLLHPSTLNWKGLISETLIGGYPFWYLWMLTGLYLTVPVLRVISRDRKAAWYFVMLSAGIQFLLSYGVHLPVVGRTVEGILPRCHFYFAMGFTGYYLLGHLLLDCTLSDRQERAVYALGLAGLLFTCLATRWLSKAEGSHNEWFSRYLMPNVMLESAALFVFFTRRVSRIRFSRRTAALLKNLSTLTFGVYLTHPVVLEVLGAWNVTVSPRAPLASALVLAAAVFGICLCLSWAIRKIPVIGKNLT